MDNIQIITGNLFNTEADIIAHQVNCMGVMRSGVAAEVRQRFPAVYQQYKTICDFEPVNKLLGSNQIINCNGKFIVNMFAQNSYGYDGERYTNYEAFYRCLFMLNGSFIPELSIAFPYNIGCDRGGADWDIIYLMMQKIFTKRKIFIHKLERK